MTFTQKNLRLAKELRPLLLPWVGAVVAGGLIGLRPLVDGVGLEGLLTGVVAYGFLGGLALVATMSFGHELQERTLPLLLTQPIDRSCLWSQKMLLVAAAVVAAILVEFGLLAGISSWYSGELRDPVHASFDNHEILMAGVFLVAAVCSSGFWTLFAGSILGGLVFAVSSQLLSAVGVALVMAKIGGRERPFEDSQTFVALAVVGLIYSGIFLWLSWRRFINLEVRAANLSEGIRASAGAGYRLPWSALLICRPTNSGALNLARKEMHLQKTVAQLAAGFALCWAGVILLQWLRPKDNIIYLLDIITCLYAPISSLLAGCISLGEEKGIGMTASQLALPYSPRLQWLLKLAVSASTAAILSLGLPLVLFLVTGTVLDVHSSGLWNPRDNGMLALACICAFMFLLGFWAVSLTASTVRAALVAVAGVIVFPSLAALGAYFGSLEITQTGPHGSDVTEWVMKSTAAVAVIVMLAQSLNQFRKSEERRSNLFFYSFFLGSLIVLVAFWATCFG